MLVAQSATESRATQLVRIIHKPHVLLSQNACLFATSGDMVATGRHQSGGLLHHKVVDPDDFGHPMEFWAYQ
jgi:hypothetical protein